MDVSWEVRMKRITFSVEEVDHLALKLLAIHEKKAMLEVVQEAVSSYLTKKEAYALAVTKQCRELTPSHQSY